MGNARNIAFWLVLFLLILALFNLFSGPGNTLQSKAIKYSEFVTAMEEGNVSQVQISAFLVALKMRGERVEDIAAAASVMRAKANVIDAPAGAMDIVGTGGDGIGTYNISTATSFVVAGCGIPVAKHGNRAISSKSGAADVLSCLGINLDCEMALVAKALEEAGICFLMAPRHHAAMLKP